MPKLVDHDQRRREIAAALTRLIVRVGVEGASVRAVAAEAGWSMGAVRYYFGTQEELLRFAVTLQLSEVPLRLRRVHDTVPAGPVRAHAALEELLPLDDARLAEARVWLAALGRCRIDPTLDDLRLTGWQGERYLARAAICDLVGTSWPTRPDAPLPEPLEAEAEALHVVVDGLTMMGASYPERLGPADTRRLLGAALSHARARLTAHVPDSPSVAAGRHPDPS
ncbi:MAG: TetR family transcriptional regulator [Austwickia sp.]|nr:TetR family transcriptional regulator [Austwickia sp.]MBK8437585.1 TetR family transcriptional regulator [Austwickia sp.]MBK9102851.1 TetR family transcriptional regulator [Austwickia sp.]